MGDPSMINTGVLKKNPFHGIRPYTSAEDKLFFGRDDVTREVLELLKENRFLALVGASASGKTSLIQSGIIPALITQEQHEWVPVVVRPGTKPVENLIRSFQQVFPKKLNETDIHTFLSGNQDLGDLIIDKGLGSHNYFLVVDQLEELFRSGPSMHIQSKDPGLRRFIDLLVKAATSERPGIYVMLSIRSDFIEASAAFRSLTELMNRSKYLLPQMSREAFAASITGPVGQAGVNLETGFVDYLLDDLEELEMPLPQLQHALMRTWESWSARDEREDPVSINDYQSVGTVKSAISDHLEEIYSELDHPQKLICERLFKSITAKSDQYNGFRRQASIGSIARIAHCSVEDLSDVVEAFRKPGRAFLSPHASQALKSDTVIEISHESLIRIWERLDQWVNEEYESIMMYLKLSDASAKYQQGRTELWTNPELQMALNWRDAQKPTPAWGVQYNPAFERAMVFLTTSEEELQWEEERKVMQQRRRLVLNRSIAIFMGVLVLVLGGIFILTRVRPQPIAQTNQVVEEGVNNQVPETEVLTPEQTAAEGAVVYETDLNAGRGETVTEEFSGNVPETQVEQARPVSVNERPNRRAEQTREPAVVKESTTSQGDVSTPVQEVPSNPVKPATDATPNRQYISLAKDVAAQSIEISKNPNLQGLLAYQAYKINSRNQGAYYDRDIYQGLYASLKKLISPAYNIYPNLRSSIKDVQWLSKTGSILSVSSDGSAKILSGNYADRASQITLTGTGLSNECLALSPDEKKAAIGTNGGGLVFIELENRGDVVHQDTDNGKIVLFLKNLGNTGSFVSGGTENRILKWNYNTYEATELAATASRLSALSATNDGRKVAYGTRDGMLMELNVASPQDVKTLSEFGRNHVTSIAYAPEGKTMVVGLVDGSLRVLSGERVLKSLSGPGARVTDIAYSHDGRFMVAASHDGKVYLWNTSDWNNPPIVFDENNGFVLAVCFSSDGKHFYSGSVDYPRFIGRPTESSLMAGQFCSLLSRNLTREEWVQFFGSEIPYEKTCPGLN